MQTTIFTIYPAFTYVFLLTPKPILTKRTSTPLHAKALLPTIQGVLCRGLRARSLALLFQTEPEAVGPQGRIYDHGTAGSSSSGP